MKLTKSKLKQLIQEELNSLTEDEEELETEPTEEYESDVGEEETIGIMLPPRQAEAVLLTLQGRLSSIMPLRDETGQFTSQEAALLDPAHEVLEDALQSWNAASAEKHKHELGDRIAASQAERGALLKRPRVDPLDPSWPKKVAGYGKKT